MGRTYAGELNRTGNAVKVAALWWWDQVKQRGASPTIEGEFRSRLEELVREHGVYSQTARLSFTLPGMHLSPILRDLRLALDLPYRLFPVATMEVTAGRVSVATSQGHLGWEVGKHWWERGKIKER